MRADNGFCGCALPFCLWSIAMHFPLCTDESVGSRGRYGASPSQDPKANPWIFSQYGLKTPICQHQICVQPSLAELSQTKVCHHFSLPFMFIILLDLSPVITDSSEKEDFFDFFRVSALLQHVQAGFEISYFEQLNLNFQESYLLHIFWRPYRLNTLCWQVIGSKPWLSWLSIEITFLALNCLCSSILSASFSSLSRLLLPRTLSYS